MQATQPRKILAVMDDLFFMVKIQEAAKQAGLPIEFLKTEVDVLERAKSSPALIIFDLNYRDVDALKLIAALKADEATKAIALIGYLSHVQGELKLQAQQAGCDAVMPRSAFSQNLPQILKRHAGS